MDEIVTTQRALLKVIRNYTASITSSSDESWTGGLIQTRLELLNSYWTDFQANHLALLHRDSSDEVGYDEEAVYAEIEDVYVKAQSKLYDLREQLNLFPSTQSTTQSEPGSQPSSTHVSMRLPRMNVPTFSGRRQDWEVFRDAFQALIHNDKHLSDVERLFYLKSHVEGEAKLAVDSFPVTGANYTPAWEIVTRYEHPRLLVQDHINELLNLRPLKDEKATELQHLSDTLERHRKQLQALRRPVEHWDDWFLSVAANCMDSRTRRAWEEELAKLDVDPVTRLQKMPTFNEVVEFLGRRSRTIGSMENSRGNHAPSTKSSTSTSSTQSKPRGFRALAVQRSESCGGCGGDHYTGHCKEFIDLDLKKRRDAVSRARLCFNCMKAGHAARNCPSRLCCSTCGALHHSLLHDGSQKRKGERPLDPTPSKRHRTVAPSTQSSPSSCPSTDRT